MGYGKRITMQRSDDVIGSNDNYFYSDSHANGYGLKPVAVVKGDTFMILNRGQLPVGSAAVEQVHVQREVSSDVTEEGDVIKTMIVCLTCEVRFDGGNNSMALLAARSLLVRARLEWVKARRSRQATVRRVLDIENEVLRDFTLVPRA